MAEIAPVMQQQFRRGAASFHATSARSVNIGLTNGLKAES